MEPPAAHRPPCPSCGYLVDPAGGTANFCPGCGQALQAAAPAPTPPLVNTVVADRYRLLSLLGEGGMGAVYKAEHIRMGKALALKLLRGPFAREEGAVARFRAEAQMVSRLSHPHTIAVFDFGELPAGDGFYLAMEYLPGRDLAALLHEVKRLDEARTVEIGQQVLGALAEAHEAGIVHRDMKPGNVMVMRTRAGEDWVKVLDFGIATWRDQAPGAAGDQAGHIVGTPSYLSPEQARGALIDGRSDLYSLGALLYELLAGHPPFQGMSPLEMVSAHLHTPPPPLTQAAPGVSPELAAVVHRALEKRPERRWASADEMRGALLSLASRAGAPGVATPRGPVRITGDLTIASRDDFEAFEREVSGLRRRRRAAPLAAGLLVAAVALTAWRWPDVFGFLQARAPAVAEALPAGLRPPDLFDGEEHEPNNTPPQANPLPLPPGPDGAPGGGVALLRGHLGAKVSDTSGDIDVFRIEVPPGPPGRILAADWSGEREGEGIRGLDVALTLNRQRAEGSERSSAPLVGSVDHGGPGRPERLRAAVEAGTYFLAVREKHADDVGPVEKPTDWYRLTVRLAAPEPGEEREPNDEPEDAASRSARYPEWRALAARNPVGEGATLRGELSAADADVLAVTGGGASGAPLALAVVPEADLGVAVERWRPDAVDLDPPPNADRVRFQLEATGTPGQLLVLDLGGAPRPGAPVLVRLKAAHGSGRWTVLGLGHGAAAGPAVLRLARTLEQAGRVDQAVELCAAFARAVPGSPARGEVLRAAVPLAGGTGRLAEEAALRVVALATPCTPAEVARRAEGFLKEHPASALVPEARRLRARALEAEAQAGGAGAAAARVRAQAAWKALLAEPGAIGAEARSRSRALAARGAGRDEPVPVCR
jgi:serine/threonine-protein kinase